MEVTFVWSWFSFWIGFVSVFASLFVLLFLFVVRNALKQAKKANTIPTAGSLDDLITWRKSK